MPAILCPELQKDAKLRKAVLYDRRPYGERRAPLDESRYPQDYKTSWGFFRGKRYWLFAVNNSK